MSGKIFWGLILILLGAGLLLDQMNYIEFGDIISTYWPSVLIIGGFLGLFNKRSSKTGNLIVMTLGILLQLNRLDYLDIDIFKLFFPVVLIIIGLSIIFSKGYSKHNTPVEPEKWSKANTSLEDTVDLFVMFSGIDTINQSQIFKGGKITAIFGGVDLNLRGASLNNNEAFLDVTALFGGVDITVPKGWRVEVRGTPILGGWENNVEINTDPNAPVLKVSGTAIFGGIEIK